MKKLEAFLSWWTGTGSVRLAGDSVDKGLNHGGETGEEDKGTS